MCLMKHNLTLKIDDELLYQAKVAAVKRRKSLSQLVRDYLVLLVSQTSDAKDLARRRIREAGRQGCYTIEARTSRDDLHDR